MRKWIQVLLAHRLEAALSALVLHRVKTNESTIARHPITNKIQSDTSNESSFRANSPTREKIILTCAAQPERIRCDDAPPAPPEHNVEAGQKNPGLHADYAVRFFNIVIRGRGGRKAVSPTPFFAWACPIRYDRERRYHPYVVSHTASPSHSISPANTHIHIYISIFDNKPPGVIDAFHPPMCIIRFTYELMEDDKGDVCFTYVFLSVFHENVGGGASS